MKKIHIYQLRKSLKVIVGLLLVVNLFRYKQNHSYQTLIGMIGLVLIFISLRKIKSQQNEKI